MASIRPDAHLLEAMQHQPLTWPKRLAELIDNSLDAHATRVAISFKHRVLTVADDGVGIKDPMAVVTLGRHEKHTGQILGRYGIGAKDAWLCTGPVIEIDSTNCGVRRRLRVDVREVAKNDWMCDDPVSEAAEGDRGTIIKIHLRSDQRVPQWKDLTDTLGWIFAPAMMSGKQIVFTDTNTPLAPVQMPPLLNTVVDSFQIDGKQVDINIGILPAGVRPKKPDFWIQHRHRFIQHSSIGTKGRCGGRICGIVSLGAGWKLSKNKDELIGDSESLEESIFQRIEHLLKQCEATAEQIETSALKTELEGLLNTALQGKREKRDKGESKGSVVAKSTGRKRANAAQVSDLPGSVTCRDGSGRRRGFSLSLVEDSEEVFGRFDALGKTVVLNLLHPVIAHAKRTNNRPILLSAASALIANHNATTDDQGNKLMAFSIGDFLSPYVKLVTSMITAGASDV